MPLHLLGKKSWNVYNPANVARVQRDEAEAQKREQEEERRQRQDEASDRIAVLRGDRDGAQQESQSALSSRRDYEDYDEQESSRRRASKKRKLLGEDDTDRDIRLAQAQAEARTPSSLPKGPTSSSVEKSQDHSITDSDGHISLIPIPAQADRPQNKKQKPDENPSHFYLSEAAAYGSKAGDTPWYSSASKDPSSIGAKESWGSTSPRRKEREVARVSANDPLAMMKRGVKQLRESERQRKEWKEQRERDLKEVEDLARQQERKKRHNRDRDRDRDTSTASTSMKGIRNFLRRTAAIAISTITTATIVTIATTTTILILILNSIIDGDHAQGLDRARRKGNDVHV